MKEGYNDIFTPAFLYDIRAELSFLQVYLRIMIGSGSVGHFIIEELG